MTEDQPQLPEQPTQGHTTASQAVPPRPQVPPVATAEQWAAGFQQTHHREPTMSEYQAAVHAGLITPERRPRDPSMQQMADGAKQVVNGARDFFNTKIAPAVENSGAKEFLRNCIAPAAQSAARSMQRSTSRPGLAKLRGLATFILPAAAFLAIISLFMPVASAMGFSVNYFSDEAGGEGGFLLFIMLVAIAASVVAVIRKANWSRITAGVVGIVAGLIGMIDGFGTMGSVSGTDGVSVGGGLVLLSLLSVVMLAAAILILLPPRQTPTIPPMPPAQPPQS
ncbi:hypothetical protein FE633_17700 [Streptomyces montanus]|uniref:Uncharacterized protein n=1 Tax=Streptomyces montanus TaxID=2580423 RepID=A0A5R9FVR6_9ACTN|nr:hypothetical protein [Streptomyces montanus]TLS44973.1 hypothetical protein FE633_17700 [Streptomyces montanus]